jgi:acetyltransferase-like isoleucine patch superfamily enzyme
MNLESQIEGKIQADEIHIGKGVRIEPDVLITGKHGAARKVVLGDFCYIGRHTRILAPEFSLGDYSKLDAFSFAQGEKPLQIGRNCWIGGNTVLDSMGGLDIDDNVGIGAESQIWTHIQFGDIVEGSRFFSQKYMLIEKDAWFVGHCILSSVRVGERSMAMVGSVITKDVLPNHIYAGVPAKDVSEKLGFQFESISIQEKAKRLQDLIDEFVSRKPQYQGKLAVVQSPSDRRENVCCFDVSQRVYTKNYLDAEIAFLKSYVPLVKFAPEGEPPFIIVQEERSLKND